MDGKRLAAYQPFCKSIRHRRAGRRCMNPRTGLRVERLEPRQLLATDLASISGTVFDDLDGDGSFDSSTESGIAGVFVSLSGSDASGPVSRTMVTDGNGLYRFDNLAEGSYQVSQVPPPPPGFLPDPGGSPASVTVTAADAAGTAGTTIDAFGGTTQTVTAAVPGTNPGSSSESDSQAIGGTRDLWAEITSATGQTELSANVATNPGVLASTSASNSTANYVVTWDGDSAPDNLDPTGLSGVDLTDQGASTALRMLVGVDQPNQLLTVRVYSEATNWSQVTVALTETGGLPTAEVLVPYASGFSVGGGSGADFENVGAVQLLYGATESAADFAIDTIESIGPTMFVRNFANEAATPAIAVEKASNNQDADSPTGPQVAVGSNVTFDYAVSNAGATELTNISVTDDNGTPADPTDDFSPTPVLSGGFNIGDTNQNRALDTTEQWRFQATRTATAGQHTNIGTVTGESPRAVQVTGQDPSNHFGVQGGIDLQKATNGVDADTPGSGPQLYAGTAAAFTYTVQNTGNVPLSGVTVRDDNGTDTDGTDDFFATYTGGDVNGDGRLDLTEAWTFTASRVVTEGPYQNVGTALANDPLSQQVTDSDPSNHVGIPAPPIVSKRRFLASS